MIQHMYSPNNSLLQGQFRQRNQQQKSTKSQQQQQHLQHSQHPHPSLNGNPFLFEALEVHDAAGQIPLGTLAFNTYITGVPADIHSAISQNTSPLSASHVPICKGTSKHFFKLENKIALLKEVVAVNPFENTSRWRIVSANYNIWTSANQPDRFYAAVDYLPRKVREMLAIFKNSLKKEDKNSKGEDGASGTSSGSILKPDSAKGSKSSLGASREGLPNSSGEFAGTYPPGSSANDLLDEAESQELRSLLYEVYQMMDNVGKADRQKRQTTKRLKTETPRSQSLSLSFRSPEKMDIDKIKQKERSSMMAGILKQQQQRHTQASSEHTLTPSHLSLFPTLEAQFNFDLVSSNHTNTAAKDPSTIAGITADSPDGSASSTHEATGFQVNAGQLQVLTKLLSPIVNRLNHLENKLLIIENINRNNLGLPANMVPFNETLKPGHPPFQDLPLLYTALDVENLSEDQLHTYLKYYHVSVESNTSTSAKKRKLACFLGILNPDNYSNYLRN